MFLKPPGEKIAELLHSAHTIAVGGAVGGPDPPEPRRRACAAALRLPHHPGDAGGAQILGEVAVPALERLPEMLAPGERVDIVDVSAARNTFRAWWMSASF